VRAPAFVLTRCQATVRNAGSHQVEQITKPSDAA
jgi:hypothetical protein